MKVIYVIMFMFTSPGESGTMSAGINLQFEGLTFCQEQARNFARNARGKSMVISGKTITVVSADCEILIAGEFFAGQGLFSY